MVIFLFIFIYIYTLNLLIDQFIGSLFIYHKVKTWEITGGKILNVVYFKEISQKVKKGNQS